MCRNCRQMAEEQAEYCHVFANASRILILWELAAGEMTVNHIADVLSMSPQSASQHLSLMRAGGVLERRREGQQIYYRIAPDGGPHHCELLNAARRRAFDTQTLANKFPEEYHDRVSP